MNNVLTFKNMTIATTVLMAVIVLGTYTSQRKISTIQEIHPQYPADFSNDRILVGASHVVFVGKVVKQTGNVDFLETPSTQFEVEVIKNIKGDLSGLVTIDQLGGYKDGVLYIVREDTLLPENTKDDTAPLQPGSTYLFAARYNEANGQYVLITHPNALTLISSDVELDRFQLIDMATREEKITTFEEAYKNEVLLESDIQNNNTRNSYKLLRSNK